ncbi:class I SAM-dependent DNA methyltransferase [bacterium]|nr:class I SAM-dependent DNA methyltransferase [bacterium]
MTDNINPYLISGIDITVASRTKPLNGAPKIKVGSAFLDGGFLIIDDFTRDKIIQENGQLAKYIKRFISAQEFINNDTSKWCLYLKDIDPLLLSTSMTIHERIKNVKEFRESSKRPSTKRMAQFPTLFGEDRQPASNYLLIPKVSSENRVYIPIGNMSTEDVITDKVFAVENADLYHFGVLTSIMHMTWMRYTAGRLESRYSYSSTIVYNNFPWPENVNEQKRERVKVLAQVVINIRTSFEGSNYAMLYNPLTMPPKLLKAHKELDQAVDKCYRSVPFKDERDRMEYLFTEYERLTQGKTQ